MTACQTPKRSAVPAAQLFDVVMQFRAIFSDDASPQEAPQAAGGAPHLGEGDGGAVYSWAQHRMWVAPHRLPLLCRVHASGLWPAWGMLVPGTLCVCKRLALLETCTGSCGVCCPAAGWGRHGALSELCAYSTSASPRNAVSKASAACLGVCVHHPRILPLMG